MVVCSFIWAMDVQGVKEYRVKDTMPAEQNVFKFIRPDIVGSMAKSSILRTLPERITVGVGHMAWYGHVGDLRVCLYYIQRGLPSKELQGEQLMVSGRSERPRMDPMLKCPRGTGGIEVGVCLPPF
jgi:hypothetical protein